jgi:hypothetical protein
MQFLFLVQCIMILMVKFAMNINSECLFVICSTSSIRLVPSMECRAVVVGLT